MRKNRMEGGRAEQSLRAAVTAAGLRYQVHPMDLAGRPDLVFSKARLCVFCDGDFWHGRNWSRLQVSLRRRSNPSYWTRKIARNLQRDREQTRLLRRAGWRVLRFWETDILRDPIPAVLVIRDIVKSGGPRSRA